MFRTHQFRNLTEPLEGLGFDKKKLSKEDLYEMEQPGFFENDKEEKNSS